MKWLHRLLGRRKQDEELEKELRFHLDQHAADLIAQGLDPEEARRRARLAIGGPEQVKERCRDARGTRWLEDLLQDLRYGARTLMKIPGFTLIAVVTLALGIGANTAIFSVVNALMLRPLPYPDPERLVWVDYASSKNTGGEVLSAHFLNWREQNQTLEGIAQFDPTTRTLTGAGEPERVEVGQISASFFTTLGVQPLPPGRNFTAAEDKTGGERVAILSHGLWRRRYNSDQDIVGKTITLNDSIFTVVGVTPENFRY